MRGGLHRRKENRLLGLTGVSHAGYWVVGPAGVWARWLIGCFGPSLQLEFGPRLVLLGQIWAKKKGPMGLGSIIK